MSQPKTPSSKAYDPLPLTNDDHIGQALYNAPQVAQASTMSVDATDNYPGYIPEDDFAAPRPRFIGAAAFADSNPSFRNSYASSHHTYGSTGGSEYNSSVYDLQAGAARPYYAGGYRDDPNMDGTPMSELGGSPYLHQKRATYAAPKSKRKVLIWSIVVGVILLIAGVVVAIYFTVIKPKAEHSSSSANKNTDSSGPNNSTTTAPQVAIVSGGQGSTVVMEDGSTMVYNNTFGGTWYQDPNDPFNNNAQCNSWTPPLNSTFNYGTDKIYGVNLGGWLTLEPFICPAVFEPYVSQGVVDEYTLHPAMRADTANGGISQLETHYATFITEADFAAIASAGLNYVRIPLPYWAIEVRAGEPFEPNVAWKYFLKAIQWARKYGLRINLDFHALPGSQNGWNHSGKLGNVGVMYGPMGLANAQRSLDYIRILAEFISQPEYSSVVTMFGITNEPQGSMVGQDVLSAYYVEAYNIVRAAGGTGAGNGPFISYHDGFFQRSQWAGFMPNADRIALDSHPYLCFGTQSDAPITTYASTPCQAWGGIVNTSMSAFGMTAAGEFSNAVTDCGLWVNGVGLGTRYSGNFSGGPTAPAGDGNCNVWTDYANFDQTTKQGLLTFAMASMDALQNWFFWTWKIGQSNVTGKIESPQWSYSLGLQEGWMPTDPRQATGQCGNQNPWQPPLTPAQTGGAGAGNIPASATATLPWPPPAISSGGPASLLPTYTPTGAVPTLPAPTFTYGTGSGVPTPTATPNVGSGWTNASDNAGLMVNVTGCNYLDPWGPPVAPPSPLCGS